MHVVTTTKALFMGPSLGELPAGRWLCSDANAFELAMIADRGTVKLEHWEKNGLNLNQPANELPVINRILVVRSGAIGDLLFLTPAIKALGEKYPNSLISLSCFPKHHQVMLDCPALLKPYPFPEESFPEESLKEYDLVFGLDNVVELAVGKHATDAFAEALGVTITDYTPLYKVTSKEKEWAKSSVPKGNLPRVAIQLRASVRNRDYPMDQWNQVIDGLVARGWEVLLYGSKGQVPPLPRGTPSQVIDCSSMTFREAAVVLETCDAFVGVDSAWVNMCPALGIPAIGLYGPFPWQSRTSHAPKTRALSGVGDCANCCWSVQAGRHFPPDKECAKTQVCSVMASIEPNRILAKVDALRPAAISVH